MSEAPLDPELAALAANLRTLSPAAVRLDRDRLLFRAGQESARRHRWRWPAATAAACLAAAALGGVLILRPDPQPVQQIVYIKISEPATTPVPKQPSPTPAPDTAPAFVSTHPETVAAGPAREGYLHLRDEVLRWGVEVLHDPPTLSGTPAPAHPTRVVELPPRAFGVLAWPRLSFTSSKGGPS